MRKKIREDFNNCTCLSVSTLQDHTKQTWPTSCQILQLRLYINQPMKKITTGPRGGRNHTANLKSFSFFLSVRPKPCIIHVQLQQHTHTLLYPPRALDRLSLFACDLPHLVIMKLQPKLNWLRAVLVLVPSILPASVFMSPSIFAKWFCRYKGRGVRREEKQGRLPCARLCSVVPKRNYQSLKQFGINEINARRLHKRNALPILSESTIPSSHKLWRTSFTVCETIGANWPLNQLQNQSTKH